MSNYCQKVHTNNVIFLFLPDDRPVLLLPLTECSEGADFSLYGQTTTSTDFTWCDAPFDDVYHKVACFGDLSTQVTVDTSVTLDTTNSIAILLHLAATSNGTILSFDDDMGVGLRMDVDVNGDATLIFETVCRDDDSVRATVEFSSFPLGDTAYVAAMYDGTTGLMTLQVNSLSATSYTYDPPIQLATQGTLYVGDVNGDVIDGTIYCVQIYDRVLTSDEITTLEDCPLGQSQQMLFFLHHGNIMYSQIVAVLDSYNALYDNCIMNAILMLVSGRCSGGTLQHLPNVDLMLYV